MCTSRPKAPPPPPPVIERQAYRSPVARDAIGSTSDPSARRRLQGVATSAQGITTPASTTRQRFGGDAPLNPSIGGGGGASVVSASPSVQATASIMRGPRGGAGQPRSNDIRQFFLPAWRLARPGAVL